MLGIRRKSSSSRRPCSRVSSRNCSGVANGGYLRQQATFPSPFCWRAGWWLLVDEPQEVESSRGPDRPVIDPAPPAVVHLRDGEGSVPVHGLDIGHVAHR